MEDTWKMKKPEYKCGVKKLLTTNTKLAKSVPGYYITGLSLFPDKILCPYATPACEAGCIVKSGHARVHPAVKQAYLNRRKWYYSDIDTFLQALHYEIGAEKRKAERKGLKLAVRLNVYSDIKWEALGIIERYPDVQFYDYTKIPLFNRVQAPNYHLTFSWSENIFGQMHAISYLETKQTSVAVVFASPELPDTFKGFPVIDGDESDARWLDPKGVVIGLKYKKGDGNLEELIKAGFVIDNRKEAVA